MHNLYITNSFRIASNANLEELKRIKINALKELTYKLITEKYPLYKQINAGKSGIQGVNEIRAKCNKLENKIKEYEDEVLLLNLNINEDYLRNLYGIQKE